VNRPDGEGFPPDFRDFVAELNRHGVEYLLVGGYAVGVYGHVRATADIDFLYRRTPANVNRLLQALADFGAPADVLDEAHLAADDAVTAFGAPPLRIDLLSSISGVSFDEAAASSVRIDVGGEQLPVIGLTALRANKKASGRRKDREDLRRLPEA
jgi:predicted nucleotidyltransferase